MTDPKFEYKFEHQWGGEETWNTKSKMWARNQKYPFNQIYLSLIEWLWKKWIDGKVMLEMSDVDKQSEEIVSTWESEDGDQWNKREIKSEPSEVEGLDNISISFENER